MFMKIAAIGKNNMPKIKNIGIIIIFNQIYLDFEIY